MEVSRYFHDTADAFDALYREDGTLRTWFNRIFRRGLYERVVLTIRELETMEQPRVLDVGCGSGRNSVLFVKAGARHVVGVDFSERMLELAEEAAQTHGVASACTFVQADFLDYEPDEPFESVVALGVFDYVADPVPFLRRMAAVSSGTVIGSFPGIAPVRTALRKVRYTLRGCPLYFYSRRRLERVCREAGLHSYRIIPYASSGYLLVGQVQPPPEE